MAIIGGLSDDNNLFFDSFFVFFLSDNVYYEIIICLSCRSQCEKSNDKAD